ncbi:MAG: AraC family transcriptional regulator [Clostridia bacterium]|nr:AraC family transcriptional regulator [Clostridia bacterium]
MIYQKIFTGDAPYQVMTGALPEYPEHRHADFEFNYCVEGCFHIEIEGKTHLVQEGCTTFIPPMCRHKIPVGNDCKATTVIVGVSLLNRRFNDFLRFDLKPEVCNLNELDDKKIKELFLECAEVGDKKSAEAELIVIGNIYKILAYFLRTLSTTGDYATSGRHFSRIADIEKAIELIQFNYKESLTVEGVAEELGYSKSNFCTIFKKTIGEGFHATLNRHRVACATELLTVSNIPIADVAIEVGFAETKSFCRVFKSIMGVTPGEYRKKVKSKK